jgi:hypothetical protein
MPDARRQAGDPVKFYGHLKRQPCRLQKSTGHQPSCVLHRAKFACGCGSVRPLSRIADRRNFALGENSYGLGSGVGRGLGLGTALGVELAVAVAVAVGVAVAVADAVGVGVCVTVDDGDGVAVGPHADGVPVAVGVGLGVGVGDGVPTAAAISMRPQPYTLFGGPAVPHWVEEINTAELFNASRLAVI